MRGERTDLPPVEVRFARSYVVQPDGCWEWQLHRIRGYGMFRVNGRGLSAHRYSWELANGRSIPDGLTIDHLCRNRSCVNPEHLEPVTNRENTLRGEAVTAVNARKTECVHGHPFSLENTYITPRGERQCRTCALGRARRWQARRRARAA